MYPSLKNSVLKSCNEKNLRMRLMLVFKLKQKSENQVIIWNLNNYKLTLQASSMALVKVPAFGAQKKT